MKRILIYGATVISGDDGRRVFSPGVVGVAGDRIRYIGESEPDWGNCERIDGTGCLLIPGLINAHTHVGMTVMRGLADDLSLMDWLREKVWPMEAAMSAEDRHWSARLAMLEMIRGGVTGFLDMSPDSEGVARACEEIGIRARLSEVLLETQDPGWKTLESAIERLAEWRRGKHPLVDFDLGPHALYTSSRAYFEALLKAARDMDARLQIHVAETVDNVKDCRRKYGKSPVEVLDEWGLFERPTTAAHCIHLSARDREILAERGVIAAHNPTSNMKLGAGIMSAEALLAAGVTIALGTDSAASNNNLSVLGEMRRASLLQKVGDGDSTSFGAAKVLRAATLGGASAMGRSHELGRIRKGYLADLTLIRADGLHACPPADPLSHLIYALRTDDVDTVLVGGRVLLRHGTFTEIDAGEVKARCAEIAGRIRA